MRSPRALRCCALLCLLGCNKASEPGAPPPQAGFVRVYLRSLGDWKVLTIRGKGGLAVGGATRDRFLLHRSEARSLRFRPRQGIVRVGSRSYAGELIWRHGKLVNRVSLENYVLGVLRGELPLKQVPAAAAGALAIAARSYALHYLGQRRKQFDLDDTTLYQVYAGLAYAPDDDHLRGGVQATTGIYLAYRDKPLKAYYHSTCGGHTTDLPTGLDRADQKPMRGVACAFCRASKYWRWKVRIPEAVLSAAAGLSRPVDRFEIRERGAGGRATRVRLMAGAESKTMRASEFRLRVGPSLLRSTRILAVQRVEQGFEFEGAGWGHGVGLCQMGAIGLARRNWSAAKIACYYYPGAALRRVY